MLRLPLSILLASAGVCSPATEESKPPELPPRCKSVASCPEERLTCGYDAECGQQRCICLTEAPADPGSGEPTAASVAPSEAPAVEVDWVEGEDPPVLEVRIAGSEPLRIGSGFVDCENVDHSLESLPERGDVRVVQLFCENGEDYFSREVMTTLVRLGPPVELVWAGGGSYRNEMGVCEQIDVAWFEAVDPTHLAVVRTTSVLRTEQPGLEDFDCEPEPEKRTVEDTLDLGPDPFPPANAAEEPSG